MIIPDPLISQMLAGASPVRVLRLHRKMTQAELASRAGLFPAEIKRIEESKRIRRDEVAERLAEALEVSPCALQVRGLYRGCEDALEGLDG